MGLISDPSRPNTQMLEVCVHHIAIHTLVHIIDNEASKKFGMCGGNSHENSSSSNQTRSNQFCIIHHIWTQLENWCSTKVLETLSFRSACKSSAEYFKLGTTYIVNIYSSTIIMLKYLECFAFYTYLKTVATLRVCDKFDWSLMYYRSISNPIKFTHISNVCIMRCLYHMFWYYRNSI